ncbi:mediator of RNA polymerase II transcription subunit 19a-like [Coffea eugenioides]|uniref:Mediator of RNA polymerase II transcription subunit 19a-like n=1 Tax=Coffea arabica TaxID=13443 RepID=A0A6P6UF07_COFAR|nr:mediator of RNA polymerase II transcription subunit 19a-like [Coffea arabica]XP_027089134.1 mediator of RNA polymerase II transcription subunit 19a-like [Coffea arabica]XP_027089136.1 mediator of RNA polymerase II transcription subunit 19a-like [Coffea arabica]XP_027185445.1 mediator of RNA polymerase II transcription subunit 19a-like [Coffea eugenioides]XP_027185446.1 mediator of RNA polymerase II transcription subunit 19a-like [Coffea eugenioides]
MDLAKPMFGRGPSELCGAVDLISRYKLWPHHDYFCKRPPPLSLSESPYLSNLVGDLQIRKGEGMELGQLLQGTSCTGDRNEHMHRFDLDILSEAFQIKETTDFDLAYVAASKFKSKGVRKHERRKDMRAQKKKDIKKPKGCHNRTSIQKEE